MSRKYERTKARWARYPRAVQIILRTASSITLGVSLLGFVILWGFLGTLPVGPLPTWILRGLSYAAIAAGCALLARMLGTRLAHRYLPRHSTVLSILFAAGGLALGVLACIQVQRATGDWVLFRDFYRTYLATTVYKLPALDMTELEFYAAWPLTSVLLLFVANMVIATYCRIEFRLRNAGVLMAHAGVVTLAIGCLIYSRGKEEGDTLLMKEEIGGGTVDYFYDGTTTALYMTRLETGAHLMLPLEDLPRYNDSMEGKTRIDLHDAKEFQELFGPALTATVDGFLAYGRLERTWTEGDGGAPANPVLEACITVPGLSDHTIPFMMAAREPEQRAYRNEFFDLEYTVGLIDSPTIRKLATPFEGEHALIAEVPGAGYQELLPVTEGQELTLGRTGYRLVVERLGERYTMPIRTAGFEELQPTVAVVRVVAPDGSSRQRWIFHPYVQLTQDFVDDPDGGRPTRLPPDGNLILTYLDASHDRFFIFQPEPDSFDRAAFLARRAGGKAEVIPLRISQEAELFDMNGHSLNLIINGFMRSAKPELVGVPVPRAERDADQEGTYSQALVGVTITYDEGHGPSWSRRVWLPNVLYMEEPGEGKEPLRVEVPGYGEVELSFGRLRRNLPVSLRMEGFELVTYPGSDLPKDYRSTLLVRDASGREETLVTRMNHPIVRHGYKFSQSAWDPENQAYTIIGVGNNPGVNLIASGAILAFLGIPFAFYVKPRLKRREAARNQAQAARIQAQAGPLHDAAPEPASPKKERAVS
jgi:hypothetical protein